MNEPLHRLSLVGRQNEMKTILENFRLLDRPVVIYIEGEGGIGKTALLGAALEEMRKQKRGIVASRIIDLYHLDYQLPRGFVLGVIEALDAADAFKRYKALADDLDAKVQRGEVQPQEAMHRVWMQFIEDLSALAQEKGPLVIAVDTVEVLDYLRDRFQEEAGLSPILYPELIGAFVKYSGELRGPILWLLAGRPSAVRKRFEEEGLLSEGKVITLGPLSKEEAFEYIERLMSQVGKEAKARLERATQTYGESFYRETTGRPILLAMVADIIASGGALPDTFYQEDAPEQDTQDALEERLLRKLLETEGIGTTLRKMAMLRKGANARLLAMLEIVEKERVSKEEEEQAQHRLERIAQLVLVKKRPEGERPYFLHDEIYAMFDRHPEYLPTEEDRRRYWGQVRRYYEEEEKHLRTLGIQKGGHERANLKMVLDGLQAEYLHYLLWQDPRKGFTYYFLRTEDALDGRDQDLFLLLRGELLRTVSALQALKRLPVEIINWIRGDSARWIGYTLFIEDNPQEAKSILQKYRAWLKRQKADPHAVSHTLVQAYLNLYEGIIQVKISGEGIETQNTLREAVLLLNREEEWLHSDYRRIGEAILAYVTSYLGYAERMRGRYYQAIDHYQEASAYFRRLHLNSLTTTLANMAYAMALIGKYRNARQALYEADILVRHVDSSFQRAVVLNVACIVEVLAGHLSTAQEKAGRALRILDSAQIEAPLLRAFIYTNQARAYRHMWNRAVIEGYWEEHLRDRLWAAYSSIQKALEETRGTLVYKVERWIEAGCIYREMGRIHRKRNYQGKYKALPEDVFEESSMNADRYLMTAAGVLDDPHDDLHAEYLSALTSEDVEGWKSKIDQRVSCLAGDVYLPALSLVNLGWHWFYQRREDSLLEAIYKLVYSLIPSEYHLPTPTINRNQANILLWGILGKIEMLIFYNALQGWNAASPEIRMEKLKQYTRYAVRAFEYNHLLGATYDLRRVEDGLNRRILSLEGWEQDLLPHLYRYGEQAALELKLRGVDFSDRQAMLLQWLEERFGPAKIWLSR